MDAHQPRRILLVDDHAAIRGGLALVLTEEGIGDCIGVAGRTEALEATGDGLPDLALVDLSVEGALDLVGELRARGVAVLVCSMHEAPGYVRRALEAGARGYITKREAPQELARVVRDILDGWVLITPGAAEGLR